jgi:Predicted aminoglycoside phosphotransferase
MLDYTDAQVKRIAASIAGTNHVEVEAIGNHELRRNLVYKIMVPDSMPLVLKFYYIKNRINREIAALSLLRNTGVKCPEIIRWGSLSNGIEWLLCSYMEGKPFERFIRKMPRDSVCRIFRSMGEKLGKIHSLKTFDFCGNWDERGKSIEHNVDYFSYFVNRTEKDIGDVLKYDDAPEWDMIVKAVQRVRDNYHLIEGIHEYRLCHNDFDGRNILVKEDGDVWDICGIIDFEQSMPGNIELDIAGLYQKYFLDDSSLEKEFFSTYNQYISFDMEFYSRLEFYLLCRAIGICSWTYKRVPGYYREGVDLIDRIVNHG